MLYAGEKDDIQVDNIINPLVIQLWEINQTNSFDFIEKFLRIKQPKFEIFVAKPKPKPATRSKLNPPTKPEPKPAENFIISDPKVWQNDSLWLYEQIVNDNIQT